MRSFAPAKLNLYLHITGKQPDGYHLLDSLVAFTGIGDEVILEPAARFDFAITGPMAGRLHEEPWETNLVVRAAWQLAAMLDQQPNFKLTLVKNLPVASGIGGGSSDAAAALRLVAAHYGLEPVDPRLTSIAAALGSDVPCCLTMTSCYFCGTGAVTEPGPVLPTTPVVLVNPNEALPTPAVYKARQGAFSPAARLPHAPADSTELAAMLAARRNDLTEAACSLKPTVRDVLAALAATPDCLLARMSGSGATCFGLYATTAAAQVAARQLVECYPTWWVQASDLPVLL
jgi:4-diphosphocytidyl-2-C-methyl-D-erythritol kinase